MKSPDRKWRSALALATGIMTFAAAVASAVYTFDKRLEKIDSRIQKLDSAVRALNVNQSDEKYKELIRQLLAEQQQETPVMSGGLIGKSYAAKYIPVVHTFGMKPLAAADADASAPEARPPKP